MEGIKRRRLGSEAWQELFRRHADSGEPIGTFCRREGVSPHSYRRWKQRLGGQASMARPIKQGATLKLERSNAMTAAPFVDLGAIGAPAPAGGRLEVRLDLGDGLTLHLVRG